MSRGVCLQASWPGCPRGPDCRVAGSTNVAEKRPDISSFGASQDSSTECRALASRQTWEIPETEEEELPAAVPMQRAAGPAGRSTEVDYNPSGQESGVAAHAGRGLKPSQATSDWAKLSSSGYQVGLLYPSCRPSWTGGDCPEDTETMKGTRQY